MKMGFLIFLFYSHTYSISQNTRFFLSPGKIVEFDLYHFLLTPSTVCRTRFSETRSHTRLGHVHETRGPTLQKRQKRYRHYFDIII